MRNSSKASFGQANSLRPLCELLSRQLGNRSSQCHSFPESTFCSRHRVFQGSKKHHTDDSASCTGAGWIQSLDLGLQPIQIIIEMLNNFRPGSKTKQAFSLSLSFFNQISMILLKFQFSIYFPKIHSQIYCLSS